MHLETSLFGVLIELQPLLVAKTFTTSMPFPPPRCASIMPWMYRTATGPTLAQYFDAATGATPLAAGCCLASGKRGRSGSSSSARCRHHTGVACARLGSNRLPRCSLVLNRLARTARRECEHESHAY